MPTTASRPLLESLANARRRRTLEVLTDRTAPVPVAELATHVVAAAREKPLVEITAAEVAAVRADLHHVHLPRLADEGLVDWDRAEATVTTTDHPALEAPSFGRIVETEAEGWDAVVETLAHRRRRIALSVLVDRGEPMGMAPLARAVHAHERETEADVDADELEAVRTALHHVHLPKMDRADLVSYDGDDGRVEYAGHPELDESWLDFDAEAEPQAVVADAHATDGVWTVEGRENVLERGRTLFDYADDELFLLLTTDGLFEEACMRRLAETVDRGVDVYLGTQTRELRDLVREELPEVTLWEPQLDWLNLPPSGETVGRLVLADREAIMIGTLGDETDSGVQAERAVTATGEDNAVVALFRDMLGARLDHLDAQSEDFRSQIPL